MAFVNLGASSLLPTAKVGKTPATCPLSSSRAPLAHTRARNAPRMAFSSIDTPEEAVVLSDIDFETKQAVLYAAYKHVFGNAYLMEEERAELATAESDFLYKGTSTLSLIRAMGKSNAYQKRFFAKSSPYRFVELNCKHFLGRGPRDQDEISFHVQKLVNEGFEAEIDSYFDSGEYLDRFGELGVPRFIYEGAYPKNDDFSRMNVMRMHWDGCSTSTKYGSTAPGRPMDADLLGGRGSYVNGFVKISKGLRAGFRPEPQTPAPFQGVPSNPQAPLKTRIKVAENLYQVIEIPGVSEVSETLPSWKKDALAANPGRKLNGVFY